MLYDHFIPLVKDKIRDMPHVYYFNLDQDVDRREYMESQFNEYGIRYTRVSQSKYIKEDFDSWEHLIEDPQFIKDTHDDSKGRINIKGHLANTVTHLDFFNWWINNTDDNNLIIMEDDYDLSIIEDWHFTWGYLMNNIPYDWDAIQFSFEPNNGFIHFFLHPRYLEEIGFGAMMLNRNYIQKILNIAYTFDNKLSTKNQKNIHPSAGPPLLKFQCSPDTLIGGTGMTYRIPLVTMNQKFYREEFYDKSQVHHFETERAVKEWWKNKRDEFSLEEFFTYGKPSDPAMTVNIEKKDNVVSYG